MKVVHDRPWHPAVTTLAIAALTVMPTLPAHAAVSTTASAPTPRPAVTTSPAPQPAFRADARLPQPRALVHGVADPSVWWSFDGRSARPRLVALGADGRVRATYTVTGARRWDALTIVKGENGAGTLVLADLAEARSGRGVLSLYRIPEPARPADGRLAAQPFKVGFPDGPHEAGTLMADQREGRLYIVTRASTSAAVYALPAVLNPGLDNVLTRIRRLPFAVRGGAFTRDGRVVLRAPDALRVLSGVREQVTHVIRLDAAGAAAGAANPGPAFGVSADGRRALLADTGARPMFRAVALPAGAKAGRPRPSSTVALTERSRPVSYPVGDGLPGGLIGTGALAGLGLLGLLGGGFYLRGRRRDG
ncbi:hypothetical protein [Actinomadura hibisca]|uniref:hypothetical protein n=1 Tax=Actinomadura hibisca TaxID=68565 RepID=UPI00082F505A|nr:hypothetical protein [Actinomadura hibisca]